MRQVADLPILNVALNSLCDDVVRLLGLVHYIVYQQHLFFLLKLGGGFCRGNLFVFIYN